MKNSFDNLAFLFNEVIPFVAKIISAEIYLEPLTLSVARLVQADFTVANSQATLAWSNVTIDSSSISPLPSL